ncbi:MAG TPA: tetratricopeptide repeat protein [Polyangiaceae bacterium]|nr:tetratricopeptide repeat protein [Polyangiaceae bacterium]
MERYDPRSQEAIDDPEALVDMLEKQLRAEPALSDDERVALHARLASLYLEKLEDPLSAAVHVEELLERDEGDGASLELATELLKCRPIAARIAEKLSLAYRRRNEPEREADMLGVELTIAKPERLDAVMRRLAELKLSHFDDPASAAALLSPLVRKEPEDVELVARYVDAATKAEKVEEAVSVLSAAHDIAMGVARARLGHALGTLYLTEGELPSARAAFASAVVENLSDEAVLASARRLVALSREPEDPALLAPALAVIVAQEPDVVARQTAAERLLALGVFAEDDVRAIPTWQALLESSRAEEALARLERLYELAGNRDGLAAVLHLRALRTPDPEAARALAVRSAELRTESGGEAAIDAWKFIAETYGGSREIDQKLAPLLEGAERFDELVELLEKLAADAPPVESAAAHAKIGQVRLSRLGQEDAALASLRRAVELDPTNTLARIYLERLVAEGARRAEAADLLESVSVAADSDEGLLAALEAKAELAASTDEALAVIARGVEIASRDPERALRGLLLAGRALALSAASRPEEIAAWREKTREFAAIVFDRAMEASVVFEAAQACAIDSPPRAKLACDAIDLLVADGRAADALGLSLRALETFPGSLALSERVDRLTAGREPPEARLARYETTLDNLEDRGERLRHRRAIAELARDALSDLTRAATEWRAILAEDPSDAVARDALIDAFRKTLDVSILPEGLEDVVETLDAAGRAAVLAGKARLLVARGDRDAALEACRSVLSTAEAGDAALEAVATVAYEENVQDVYHEALERLASSANANVRVQALERLGHYFEQIGNRRAAAESWKPAAMLSAGDPEGDARARELYERVLAAAPDDSEAAERLLELYVKERRWVNVPGIYATLLRASQDPGVTARKLLGLEAQAVKAGAVDELVGMLDETLPYLGSTNDDVRRELMLAKARALASSKAHLPAAAAAYRALVEASNDEKAIRAFESFVEKRLAGSARHAERRWLFQLRSERAEPSVDALLAWAREEEAHDETMAAIRAYERAAELDPARDEPIEGLSRLRAVQGDYEGALAALRALRGRSAPEKQGELDVRIAKLVGEELGRPEEALVSVAPLLSSSPPPSPVIELARRALERPDELDRTVELVERASYESADPKVAATNLELLLEAPLDEASLGERRDSWIVRLAELREKDADESLRVLTKGLASNPRSPALWDALIARARVAKRGDVVYDAFAHALEHPSADPETIERLGQRTIAFYDEWSSDSAEVQKTLEAVLEHVPAARWALDRLKLLLFASERWSELFRLYDRAIDAAREPSQRAELLDEAALAARDLARDPGRAITYLELLRAARPSDAPVTASLERLYEREGESAKLIALLQERLATATGIVKEELEQRIASLWLDLGDLGSAHALVESMLEHGVKLADVAPLLERILGVRPEHDVFESPKTPHSHAVALLVEHYQGLGRVADVIRIRERELSFARDERHRRRVVESLVELHLNAAGHDDDAFVAVIPKVAAFGRTSDALARAAAAKLRSLAEEALRRRSASPESGAAQAAYWAVRKLEDLSQQAEDPEEGVRVLLQGAELPFARTRQRALLRDAALRLGGRSDGAARAVELFRRLFAEDPTDDVVGEHVERFASWLDDALAPKDRAELWESFAQKALELGKAQTGCDYFTRAAKLWEAAGDGERAIAAWRRSASVGSHEALEALFRLYRDRGQWRPAAAALEWAFAASKGEDEARFGSLLADAYLALGERDFATARLEAVLRDVPAADAVRSRLSELYREDGAHAPLADLLVKGAGVARDPEQRLAMLREAADVVLVKLGDPARAIPILEAATKIAGNDAELASALAAALDASGRHEDAARVLRAHIASFGDLRPKSRAKVHHRLARVLLHMNDERGALSELRVASEIDPSDPEVLHDLARRALEQNELSLAESTYRALLLSLHRAESKDSPSRVEVYLDLSEVAARKNDAARAADYIESSFDVSLEGLEEALRLEKALAARGRHDLVARSVERRLRAAKDPALAAQALAELSKLAAAHAPAAPALSATIARHAAEIGKAVEEAGVTDAAIWATLAGAAQAFGGGDAGRAEVLSRRIALLGKKAEGESDAVALGCLREAARSCEQDLGDVQQALRAYEAIVARFPSDSESWEAVFRLAKGADALGRVRSLVQRVLKKTKSPDDRCTLRFGFAKALLADASERDRATAVLEELLDERPDHAEAAELLADALEREGRDADLVALLEPRFAAARKAGKVPIALSLRLATALEKSGAKGRAVDVYDAVVGDESSDARALEIVRARLEAVAAPSLADCLERLLSLRDASTDPALAKRLVELRDEASDEGGALRAAAIGFELDPRDASLRERLVREYQAKGRLDDVRDVLGRAAQALPADRPLFLSWIDAALCSSDASAAMAALDRALEASPSDTELLRERAQAKRAAGHDDEALSDLERAYELDPSFAVDVRAVLERLLESETPERDRYALALADVLVDQDEEERASELLEELLSERPEHVGALERLAALRAKNQDWAAAVEAYERLLPLASGDHELFARLTMEFAEACDRAGGSAQARAALERAHRHAPDRADLRERLEAIYEAEGDRERLAELLVETAERASESSQKAALFLRAGELLLKDDEGAARALAAIEAGRALEPSNPRASLSYARALRALDRDDEALAELLGLAERLRGKPGPSVSPVHFEIARVYLDSDYLHEGFESLKHAFQLDPRNMEAAYQLGLVGIDLCDEATASRALRAVTASRDDKLSRETKAMAFYHLARLAQWKNDKRRAQTMAKNALSENPDCDVAKALLKALSHP